MLRATSIGSAMRFSALAGRSSRVLPCRVLSHLGGDESGRDGVHGDADSPTPRRAQRCAADEEGLVVLDTTNPCRAVTNGAPPPPPDLLLHSRTGKKIWSCNIGNNRPRLWPNPVTFTVIIGIICSDLLCISNGIVYAGSSDSCIYAVGGKRAGLCDGRQQRRGLSVRRRRVDGETGVRGKLGWIYRQHVFAAINGVTSLPRPAKMPANSTAM